MKVYFVTRFSIYDPQFTGFRLSRYYDSKEYERRLFAADRLNHKFDTFQNITLPSVVGQSLGDWEWLIYTSDRMPDEYTKRLRRLVSDHPNILLIPVKDFPEFFEKDLSYNYATSFATVRLDDDDGLSNYFVEKLQQYSNQVGNVVCFTEGTLVKYVNGRVVMGKKISEINNAQGLAGIGVRIYSCGRHSDINARFNVINDSTPNMFIINCSPFADTKRGFTTWDRIVVKVKRLCFLLWNRPMEVPRELGAPLRKLLRR
jgi:putative rhamnosyltransferase